MLKTLLKRSVDRLAGSVIDRRLAAKSDQVRYALGEVQCRQSQLLPKPASMRDTEFKVFSQFGEDGVIQFLVQRLTPPDTFVEIGVSDYTESNTRFLAMKDNWRGAIFDSGTGHVNFLWSSEMGWRYSIDAVSAFVTRENVNEVVAGTGISGEIGLLSIDVDGIDYWLWEALDIVRPWIVIIEFNSAFGPEHAVTVPYDAVFAASSAHPTGQYLGGSLAAMHHLGRQKGYRLVGATSQGVNAFFVRDDVAGDLWNLHPSEAYVRSRFRTARNDDGTLAYTGSDHAALLASMADRPLVMVENGEVRSIGSVYGV